MKWRGNLSCPLFHPFTAATLFSGEISSVLIKNVPFRFRPPFLLLSSPQPSESEFAGLNFDPTLSISPFAYNEK